MIKLLDCTLRDGGYINDWNFGAENIRYIADKIVYAGVDVIEMGYLSVNNSENPNATRYFSVDQVAFIASSIPLGRQDYALMINYGEYPQEKLADASANSPILRIAFHKKDLYAAMTYVSESLKKGYRCYVQPMGVLNYSDAEFVDLILMVNTMNVEAFYIVDSFGILEMKDFRRLLFLADHNLKENIFLGYHAHNNLQQAYDNAKYMCMQPLTHNIVIDASIFGMGRGAGNLNIELFAQYLNNTIGTRYNIEAFLEVFDKCLKPIYVKTPWGYSLPFYLSAIHNVHPNYAAYFSEKNTLNVKSLNELLGMIPKDEKNNFTKDKAASYYRKYLERFIDDEEGKIKLKKEIIDKPILILAPGKTLRSYEDRIVSFIVEKKPVIIGVNRASSRFKYKYLFITNEKRLTDEKPNNVDIYIKTSNLPQIYDDTIMVNYSSYLLSEDCIADNPTLMLVNLLTSMGLTDINIAGFDGFSMKPDENYFDAGLSMGSSLQSKIERNEYIRDAVKMMRGKTKLNFITPSIYIENTENSDQ